MDEFIVEVHDVIRNSVIDHLVFRDANSAYHEYRCLENKHYGDDFIVVRLIEPE